jgi:hypothetical protein
MHAGSRRALRPSPLSFPRGLRWMVAAVKHAGILRAVRSRAFARVAAETVACFCSRSATGWLRLPGFPRRAASNEPVASFLIGHRSLRRELVEAKAGLQLAKVRRAAKNARAARAGPPRTKRCDCECGGPNSMKAAGYCSIWCNPTSWAFDVR